MMETRKAYARPTLQKVRIEVKTSVLAQCNISVWTTPTVPVACNLPSSTCFDYPRPGALPGGMSPKT